MKRKELAKKLGIVGLAWMLAMPLTVPAVYAADAQQTNTQTQEDQTPEASEAPSPDEEPAAATPESEDEKSLQFETKTYAKEYKTADGKVYKEVSFSYPYAKGSSQAAKELNQFYKKLLNKWKEAVKENLKDAKSLVEESKDSENHYGDQVSYKITSNDDQYVSVLQSGYEYTMGAHGMPYRYTYIFDAKTGKKVSAASILGISKNQLNQKVRNLFLKKFDNAKKDGDTMFYQDRSEVKATLDKMDFNENLYYLKNGKLRFYADPYAVGPYAAGFIEVAVKL